MQVEPLRAEARDSIPNHSRFGSDSCSSRHGNLLGERGLIQHLTHFCLERVQGKGLLEERDARIQRAVVADCVFRVARHVQHFHVRAYLGNALSEFASIHPRHDDIGQHQMNDSLVSHADLHRGRAIGGFDHGVALVLQELSGQAAKIGFVLHHQNRFARGFHGGCSLRSRLLDHGGCFVDRHVRHVNLERRALARLAVHPDVSAALLDDAVHRREPESRPLRSFGREEGLEDA